MWYTFYFSNPVFCVGWYLYPRGQTILASMKLIYIAFRWNMQWHMAQMLPIRYLIRLNAQIEFSKSITRKIWIDGSSNAKLLKANRTSEGKKSFFPATSVRIFLVWKIIYIFLLIYLQERSCAFFSFSYFIGPRDAEKWPNYTYTGDFDLVVLKIDFLIKKIGFLYMSKSFA